MSLKATFLYSVCLYCQYQLVITTGPANSDLDGFFNGGKDWKSMFDLSISH